MVDILEWNELRARECLSIWEMPIGAWNISRCRVLLRKLLKDG